MAVYGSFGNSVLKCMENLNDFSRPTPSSPTFGKLCFAFSGVKASFVDVILPPADLKNIGSFPRYGHLKSYEGSLKIHFLIFGGVVLEISLACP